MKQIDWSLLRSFLAVVETGSLSAAASRLGSTQPTVGRHIRDLEASIGVVLFTRMPKGLDPTPAALALVADARSMGAAAEALALKAGGRSQDLSGTVRIATSVMVANMMLPAILAELRQAEPHIQIEIVASDVPQNLLRRDADIAVRMFDPTQEALIARRIGTAPIGLYGSESYLARHGPPDALEDLARHCVIGFDRGDGIVKLYAAHGLAVTREDFPIRCDDPMAYLHLVLAGAGLGFVQTVVAARHPDLVPIDVGLRIPPMPMWLVMHEEVRSNPRIRRVADYVFTALEHQLPA